jgi:hypothetical protein
MACILKKKKKKKKVRFVPLRAAVRIAEACVPDALCEARLALCTAEIAAHDAAAALDAWPADAAADRDVAQCVARAFAATRAQSPVPQGGALDPGAEPLQRVLPAPLDPRAAGRWRAVRGDYARLLAGVCPDRAAAAVTIADAAARGATADVATADVATTDVATADVATTDGAADVEYGRAAIVDAARGAVPVLERAGKSAEAEALAALVAGHN